jgi:hypothetical protein
MTNFIIVYFLEAIACFFIYVRIVVILRSRFEQKWIELGRPTLFAIGNGTHSTKSLMKALYGTQLMELGDLELIVFVHLLRCGWIIFNLMFGIGCVWILLHFSWAHGT